MDQSISVVYPGSSLIGTRGNKTQMEMGLKWKWDSIDVLGLSTIYTYVPSVQVVLM